MTDDDIKRLKRLAEQATPGPWRVNMKGHSYHEVARVNDLEIAPPNSVDLSHWTVDAAYIAAASPDVVLALLDEIERLRAALTKANAQAERFEREWYLRGDEIEQLRADAERYRWLRGGPDVPSYSSRWPRWEVRYWGGQYWQTMFAEDLDEAIDVAMKEQKE